MTSDDVVSESVTAHAFQGQNGDSGASVIGSPLAGGGSTQVTAGAYTNALGSFTATAGTGTFDFRISGIALFVFGDAGGTARPLSNPFIDPGSRNIGAAFSFDVFLVPLTGDPNTRLFEASMQAFGHGAGNDVVPDGFGGVAFVEYSRNYVADIVGPVTYTRTDHCDGDDCNGTTFAVDPIARSLNLGPLVVGQQYAINVLMSAEIAGGSFENFARASIFDPNNLNTFDLSFGSAPPPSTIPLPASSLLLAGAVGGLAALRKRRRRT